MEAHRDNSSHAFLPAFPQLLGISWLVDTSLQSLLLSSCVSLGLFLFLIRPLSLDLGSSLPWDDLILILTIFISAETLLEVSSHSEFPSGHKL